MFADIVDWNFNFNLLKTMSIYRGFSIDCGQRSFFCNDMNVFRRMASDAFQKHGIYKEAFFGCCKRKMWPIKTTNTSDES